MLKSIFLIVWGNKCAATFWRLKNILCELAIEIGQAEGGGGYTGTQPEREQTDISPRAGRGKARVYTRYGI